MQFLVAFIVIAVGLAYFGSSLKLKSLPSFGTANISQQRQISENSVENSESGNNLKSQEKKTIKESSQKNSEKSPTLSKLPSDLSKNSIETYIRYGPLEKEVISDTTRVVFEFDAKDLPPEKQGNLVFETMVEGFDKSWQQTSSKERTIELPAGQGNYAFLVRAKIKDEMDSTPAKRNFTINVSPNFGQIKIGSFRPPSVNKPSLLILNASLKSETLNLSGWQIKGKNGVFVISQGVEKYNSSAPLSGISDIVIKNGDKISISGDMSPLADRRLSFRPNKCFGYLSSSQDFPIPALRSCPALSQNRLPRYLSQNCQSYLNSRSSCDIGSFKNAQISLFGDSACLAFIEANFSYPVCYANHSNDSDFLSREWHIYMSKPSADKEIMETKNDIIYLLDKNGLRVDSFSY